MKKQLETLRKIQEFALTKAECEAHGDTGHAASLAKTIADLEATLDPAIRGLYGRVSKTRHLFMAAVHNGACSGCGMQVPATAMRTLHIAEHPATCTTCGRILYLGAVPLAAARPASAGGKDDDTVEKQHGIARFSSPDLMIPRLNAKTPKGAISVLAEKLAAAGRVSDAAELTRMALEREDLLSTRMEDGAALPHVRGVEGGGLSFALGISHEGIVWDDTREKVNFVVLSTIPAAGSAFFLKLMSSLTAAFRRKASREAILAAEDAGSLWHALERATSRSIR